MINDSDMIHGVFGLRLLHCLVQELLNRSNDSATKTSRFPSPNSNCKPSAPRWHASKNLVAFKFTWQKWSVSVLSQHLQWNFENDDSYFKFHVKLHISLYKALVLATKSDLDHTCPCLPHQWPSTPTKGAFCLVKHWKKWKLPLDIFHLKTIVPRSSGFRFLILTQPLYAIVSYIQPFI